MELVLTPIEARVLGVLIEKATTTPDYYPLSLSGLTTGSNQKSNREPVMSLGETTVMEALDGLMAKRLVWEKTPSGSRVTKYAHRLSNTLGLTYDFSANELGVLCVLMLRGPLTTGEVRARGGRLCEFSSLDEADAVLVGLCEREDGPYVQKLPRQPGRKEARYVHLLCGEPEITTELIESPREPAQDRPDQSSRLSALEDEVAALRAELSRLRNLIEG